MNPGARLVTAARALMLGTLALTGCGTARDVAVTSFRVIDTPARYIRNRIDSPETTTTTTTQTTTSDVTNPGQPLQAPPQTVPPSQRRAVTQRRPASTPDATQRPARTDTASAAPRKPAASATPAQTAQFPIAKPVPGKPGYVYSVDPKGGIVDVTGYKPGDKAKDPYTQQIFIVP